MPLPGTQISNDMIRWNYYFPSSLDAGYQTLGLQSVSIPSSFYHVISWATLQSINVTRVKAVEYNLVLTWEIGSDITSRAISKYRRPLRHYWMILQNVIMRESKSLEKLCRDSIYRGD